MTLINGEFKCSEGLYQFQKFTHLKDPAIKDIVIIDYACTTGETLKAVHHLLTKAGVDHRKIVEAIVLFTEGEE